MEVVYMLNIDKLKNTANNRGLSFGDTGLFCILANPFVPYMPK
jgi:hypothetical protein